MSNHKRPDIEAYIHPENLNYSRSGVYKTFTEGLKPKKKEKFGKTSLENQYACSGNFEQDTCSICDQKSIFTCNCAFNDRKCPEGHIWYTDREGKINKGNPH